MSNLYDVAKRTVEADSMDEASQILFGKSGIVLNTPEYYNEVIAQFIQKKEKIIKKISRGGQEFLVFDLKSGNDLYNVVLIAECVKNELKKQLGEISKCINDLVNNKISSNRVAVESRRKQLEKLPRVTRDTILNDTEYSALLKEKQRLENLKSDLIHQRDEIRKVLGVQKAINEMKVILENSPLDASCSDALLKQCIHKVEQAIRINHKMLRNPFDHGKSIADKKTLVDCDSFCFEIPIEYLDGYNKGEIKINDCDKIAVSRTNKIVSPILEKMNYDISKLPSFFYNVGPEDLSMLLDYFDNDVHKLYQLPLTAIYLPKDAIFFDEQGIDITQLSDYAYMCIPNVIALKNLNIDVTKLPDYAFAYPEKVEPLKDIIIELIKQGKNLKNLPEEAFLYPDSTKELFNNKKIDLTKLPGLAFQNIENTRKIMDVGIEVTKLPRMVFESTDIVDITQNVIDLKDVILDLIKQGKDLTRLPRAFFLYPKSTRELFKKGIDLIDLPDNAVCFPKTLEEFRERNLTISQLPNASFYFLERAKYYLDEGIDITKLPEDAFSARMENNVIMLKDIIKKYSNQGRKYPNDALFHPDSVIELDNRGIDLTKLPDYALINSHWALEISNYGIDITKLPEIAFQCYPETIKILKDIIIELINKGKNLKNLPEEAFLFPNDTKYLADNGIDICQLPAVAFSHPENVIIFKDLEIAKLPPNAFLYPDNVRFLLKLVDNQYERLNEFPSEFFQSYVLADEMFETYNYNVSRSIFGINNPKIIAALVYANSVMKDYQREEKFHIHNADLTRLFVDDADFLKPDSAFWKMISSWRDDTLSYADNVSRSPGFVFDQEAYYKQFLETDDIEQQKAFILDKIRNAAAHFRIKPVKDKDGNIVEDKVCFYDKENESSDPNFFVVMDLKKFIGMIHMIEEKLNNQAFRFIFESGLEETSDKTI